MPWGIQKIQEIQDLLDAVGNPEIQDFLDAVRNPENPLKPENPESPGFPGCRGESRKSRITWMPCGGESTKSSKSLIYQQIQDFLNAVGNPENPGFL